MSQSTACAAPRTLPRDVYPVLRVSTEYYLRGFDLLGRLQGEALQGLIFMTIVHGQLTASHRKPPSMRGVARELGVPYETVRRHAVELMRAGQCIEQSGGLIVPPGVQNSRRVANFLRQVHANAVKLLVDLTAIDVVRYRGRPPRRPAQAALTKQQLAIAVAGTGSLLAGLKAVRTYWKGDIITGLVYTAIWTANVKHIAGTRSAGKRAVLGDALRQPVSALAISRSLRLPYETARRHIQLLVGQKIVVRLGRDGVIVPAISHRRRTDGTLAAYRIAIDFLNVLRRCGVRI